MKEKNHHKPAHLQVDFPFRTPARHYLSIGAPDVFKALNVRKRSLADIRGL